jgi:hypothetical protein
VKSQLARRETPDINDGCGPTDSRAALRRCRSLASHLRKFCIYPTSSIRTRAIPDGRGDRPLQPAVSQRRHHSQVGTKHLHSPRTRCCYSPLYQRRARRGGCCLLRSGSWTQVETKRVLLSANHLLETAEATGMVATALCWETLATPCQTAFRQPTMATAAREDELERIT